MRVFTVLGGDRIVSSIRLDEGPGHDHIHIWNRGGKCGVLTVTKGDGFEIVVRLFDVDQDELSIHDYETGDQIQ